MWCIASKAQGFRASYPQTQQGNWQDAAPALIWLNLPAEQKRNRMP
jgi:hypothetical protein